jgi:hypothetical protein
MKPIRKFSLRSSAFFAFVLTPWVCGCQSPCASPRPSQEMAGKPAVKQAEQPVAKEFQGKFVLRSEGLPDEGMWKCHPALADVNHDGQLDLIAISRKEPGLRVWLGSADGKWTDSSEGLTDVMTCGGGIDVADINNDGNLDLAVGDHCQGGLLFLGDGKGHWKPGPAAPQFLITKKGKAEALPGQYSGVEDIAMGDFDKDGALDMVMAGAFSGGIRAFRGSQGGTSWTESSKGLTTHGFCNTVLMTDMNNDGMLDIVAAHESGPRVFLGDGHGNWDEKSSGLPSPSTGGLYREIAVGDINGDGRMDLVAANWIDGIEMYWQNPNGGWDKRPDVFPDLKGGAVGVGLKDINGDGHLDIVATGRKPLDTGTVFGIFALFGNGKGDFTVHHGELPDTGLFASWCFGFGDVNNDGIQDFVVAIGGYVASNTAAPLSPIQTKLQVWTWQPAH